MGLSSEDTPFRASPEPSIGRTRSLGTRRDSTLDALELEATELPPGTKIGRYVIVERIGRGGMGEVFLAHDPRLDRPLALKLLRDEGRREDGKTLDGERMRREAQALARLSHPNVVAIYDVGQWKNRTFLAMERVDGMHLGRWLRERPRGLAEIAAVFLAAGRGLAAAHAAGIVHRDFKPANVMVGRDGRVCVLDFGLATDHGHAPGDFDSPGPERLGAEHESRDWASQGLTQTGRAVGTPAYMAPEQHRGHSTDARSDQFSFCVSLYEAVAGRRPFPGSDVSHLLRAKEGRHRLPLDEPSPGPAWIMTIIDRGLQPDPEDRYPSMDALLRALARGVRPSPRRRWLVGAGVVGVLGLGGGAWWIAAEPAPCEGGPQRVAARWNPDRAQALAHAFTNTGLGYAQASVTRVTSQLDAYAEDWVASHRSACEATYVHHEQDEAVLDRRMRCLEHHLDRLDATVGVLAEANAETVRRATVIVSTLPTHERCTQDMVSSPGPAPPATAALERTVEELRRRLATAAVLELAGRYEDGLVLARAGLDSALAVDYPPVQIEARRLVGTLLMASGAHAQAEAYLTDAALAAQALPYDELGLAAMIDLVMLLGEYLARTDEAHTWAEHARATLQRSPDLRSEARLWSTEAVVALARGRYEQSRQWAERALELRQRSLGDGHADLVVSYNTLANALRRLGRMEEAEQQYLRALELAKRVHGEEHPLTATLLLNMGGLLAEQGHHERARPVLEQALDIRRRSLGPRHPEVGTVLNNLGGVTWELGDRKAALAMLREALEIQEEALGEDDIKLVPMLHNLAEVLADDQPEEARRLAERALELLERYREPQHPRRVHTLTVLGRLAAKRGDPTEARQRLEQALALVDAQLDADHPLSAAPHRALGLLELEAGAPQAAVAHLQHALRVEEKLERTPSSLGLLRFELARARAAAGEPDDRVQPLLEQAAAHGSDSLRQEIEAWRTESAALP